MEVLKATWNLIVGLGESVCEIAVLGGVWAWEVLYHIHVNFPRMEGLLVGVVLTWLMLRRDKHPLLRVLSAPLKLIVDILDLAWDQVVEIFCDLWDTVKGWCLGVYDWAKSKVVGGYNWVLDRLKSLKEKVSKLGNKEE